MISPRIFANTAATADTPEVTGIPYVDAIISGAAKPEQGPVNRVQAMPVQDAEPIPALVPPWVWMVAGGVVLWLVLKGRR